MTPRQAFERIVNHAEVERYKYPSDYARRKLVEGTCSERLRPGGLLSGQPPEVRAALAGLTADMTNDRQT